MEFKRTRHICYIIMIFLSFYVVVLNHKLELRKSISEVSQAYIGSKYSTSPLGEGVDGKIDSDPRIRYDEFDCQTFVETVLAERLAKGRLKYLTRYYLDKIRYFASNVSFPARNHIISSDWLPNNRWLIQPWDSKNSIYEEITVNRAKWFYKSQNLVSYERLKRGQIYYKKIDNVDYYKIPDGAIIFVVKDFKNKQEKIGTNLLVSHMGFAIRKGENYDLFFRHASSKRGVVLDEPFQEYFQNAQNQSNKIKGIAIYTLRY